MPENSPKVSFVIARVGGLKGGAERIITETATHLATRGWEVEIVTFDPSPLPPAYPVDGVTLRNLLRKQSPGNAGNPRQGVMGVALSILKKTPNIFPLSHLKWWVTHGRFEAKLAHHFANNPPTVVVGFLPPAISAASRVGKRMGLPVVASTHNLPDRDFGLRADRWDQNPVYRKKALAALLHADTITVLMDEFRTWFPPDVQDKIVVLPNPVSRLAPAPTPPVPKENTILAVGRLTAIKRYDLLLRAWSRLRAHWPDWRIEIYGEGPEEDHLRALIAELGLGKSVSLNGVTDDIAHAYEQAKIMCHPSSFEGFGLSVAEAMAHGLPVVAYADCSGVNQLVRSEQDGILIAPDLPLEEGLAQALERLMRDDALRQAMSRNAQQITDRYSPDIIYGTWDRMLRGLQRGRLTPEHAQTHAS